MDNLQTINAPSLTKGRPDLAGSRAVFNRWLDGRPINPETIHEFFDWAKKNRKPTTVAHYKAAIKDAIRAARGSALTLAEAAQLTEAFKDIKPGRPEARLTGEKWVTKEQYATILEHCGDKTGLLIQALYESMARISELLSLELEHTKLIRGYYYCQARGKGGKYRTLYLRAETFRAIRRAYRGQRYLFQTSGKGKTPHSMSRHTATALLREAGARIGIRLTPHMLRHSRATHLLNDGHSVSDVASLLGHSSPEITYKFYIHGVMPEPAKVMRDIA